MTEQYNTIDKFDRMARRSLVAGEYYRDRGYEELAVFAERGEVAVTGGV